MKTGVKDHFLYGRNELGGQPFHQWVGDLVEAVDDEAYLKLLAGAEVQFQPGRRRVSATAYSPVNVGNRFSRNAATPSA